MSNKLKIKLIIINGLTAVLHSRTCSQNRKLIFTNLQ